MQPRIVHTPWIAAQIVAAALVAGGPTCVWALERPGSPPGLSEPQAHAGGTLELPAAVVVDFTSLERRLFDDLADGSLDQHTLLAAALVASGVSDASRLSGYEAQVAAFVERRRAAGFDALPPKVRGAELLTAMHRELLTGNYGRESTDVSRLLEEGHFNCVSATLLWQYLAERLGLTSQAWQLPGHMNARLMLENESLEIETTCSQWFSLLDNPEERRQAVNRLRVGSADGSEIARLLTSAGLIAAVYYNRGIDLLESGRFAEAVAANAKAHLLDPESTLVRGNLLAAINNWALDLASHYDFERAVALLADARRMAPEHTTFEINYVAVHQQWIDHLVATRQLESARAIARRMLQEMPDQPFFRRIFQELEGSTAAIGRDI